MSGGDADVAVVGAGLAGLVAARALDARGISTVVLEARDRVGGRLLNAEIGDGKVVEIGGQWIGPTQDRIRALVRDLGLETFATFEDGESLLELGGRRRRYSGTIPRVGPLVLADIAWGRFRLQRMARRVPAAAPWRAARAEQWDRLTLADWLGRGMRTAAAREMLRVAGRTIWGAEPEQLSLLHALFYVRSAGGLDPLLDTEGGAQQDRIRGGSALIAERLAEGLGARVALRWPARSIEHGPGGVTIRGDAGAVGARKAIVAVPVPLRAQIEFDPPLPAPAPELDRLVPFGRLVKCVAVYPRPFWREAGLCGEALSDRGPATLTFDNSPPDGEPGVLLGFVGGRDAEELAPLAESERRERVLAGFARLFGGRALEPERFVEQDWGRERWSSGGPTFAMPPGSWGRAGPALARQTESLSWAGTETAGRWAGFMDGAVRSGERAAAEIAASLDGNRGSPRSMAG